MAFQRRKITREEFFENNSINCTNEFLAENAYILIHTMYLKDGIHIKTEMGKLWKELFKTYMQDDTFEYMAGNNPLFTRNTAAEEIIKGKEVHSMKILERTVTALEFDLWLAERTEKGMSLELPVFEAYIHEKYGKFLDREYSNFKRFNLAYINNFSGIAEKLLPHYNKIKDFYDYIQECNKFKIQIDEPDVERTKEYKFIRKNTYERQDKGLVPYKKTIQQNIGREYQAVLNEKDSHILKLEQDIKEFKRQRDEAREYSVTQYDKGIRDLFSAINDIRYGKVIDYLYKLLQTEGIDDNLASYLDNFFMALEDMEIEPVACNGKITADEEKIVKEYNLDFDKNDFDASRAELKYTGWRYKDITIEKPTLTLKEEK